MMKDTASETKLGMTSSDTQCIGLARGQLVRVAAGSLEGVVGKVVERQPGGKWIVYIDRGVFIEVQQYLLEVLQSP